MKLKRVICLLLSLVMLFGMVSCAVEPSDPNDNPNDTPNDNSQTPVGDGKVYIVKDDKTEYSIVYSDDVVKHTNKANSLWSKIMVDCMETGEMEKYKYTLKTTEFEILIGKTNRQISKDLVAAVNKEVKADETFAWGYGYKNGKLAYYASSDQALEYSWDFFVNEIIDLKNSTVSVDDDLWVIGSKSIKEYEEETSFTVSGVWKTDNLFDNDAIKADISHSSEHSTVTLANDHYSLARMTSTFGTIKSNYYYEIRLDYELDSKYNGSDTDVRILEIWYNGNSEVRRQYVEFGKPSLAPANANKLVIEVLVRGHDTDNVKVSLPKVKEVGPYEKREVKLAAFTLKYGSVDGRPRTYQDNLDQSLAKIDELCADPANKPDLIVFTEIFYTLGVTQQNLYDGYLKLDSPEIKSIQAKAKQYGVYISFSFSEVDDNGYYYNSAPLIDRNGEIVLNYHKAHLTMKEYSKGVMPGNEIVVYETDFGKVGMAICWDLFFNEYVNLIKNAGAELIINPSLGYWDDINSIRAEDTGTYIVTAGQGYSGTAIIAPEGEILDKGNWNENDGIVKATVDLAKVYPYPGLSAASSAERDNVYHYEANDKAMEEYHKQNANDDTYGDVIDTTGYTSSGAWYTDNLFDNKAIEAQIIHSSGYTTITTKNDSYSIGRILSNFGTVKGNYYYNISVKTENSADTTDIRLLEIWYNSSGRELKRQYVEPGTPSLAPADAAQLVVEVLVRGCDADTVKLYTPKVKEAGPYEKREVKVAAFCLPYGSVNGNPRTCEDNLNDTLAKIDALCADPASKPDLIVFTETFYALGGVQLDSPADAFLKLDSPQIKSIQAKAKQYGVYISFSFSEVDEDGCYYNSAPLIDRNGEIVLNYRKVQITMKEFAKGVDPGNEVVVYDTDFGRVGMAICWDLFFNDYVNLVKDAGAEIIINPSLGWADDINAMRSEDTGTYIVTAGQSFGMTGITAPEGTILDKGNWNENDGIVTATIDLAATYPVQWLSAASSAERDNVYKYESRPDLYEKYRSQFSNQSKD